MYYANIFGVSLSIVYKYFLDPQLFFPILILLDICFHLWIISLFTPKMVL